MDSMLARLRLVCAVYVVALASCAPQNNAKECSANGEIYFCPEGTECGGLQMLCVTPAGCGNGIVDKNEQCDDGNILPGDGCSPTCQVERCGNGILDPGETCDDGNDIDSDGCTNDCQSTNICGNGITDKAVGEECDDGGKQPGDGCGPTCHFEVCGNNINDPGEECDDGNRVAGDGCSPDCHLEKCGNGIVDPGEACDDGNDIDTDNCRNDCKSDNRCGNFITDTNVGEVCDTGGVETSDCTADCRSRRACGDGIVDPGAGEECDSGVDNNKDDLDCRHDCILNRCGDGHPNLHGQHHEDCDGGAVAPDHSRAATPTETADCNSDCTTAVCDDSKVNRTAGEQCDDGAGNNADDKDCTKHCKVNVCGDGLPNTSGPNHKEECDDANRINGDDCTSQCTLPLCGDGILEDTEQCDDHNRLDNDGCSHDCKREFCGDGIVNNGEPCDPGLTPSTCNSDCTISVCGDGKLNRSAIIPEQCDDGAQVSGDGCSATCQLENCGNGVIDPHEECDGAAGPQPCAKDCHHEVCGNGVLDRDAVTGVNEECDDGNTANNDGCSHDCKREFCGDGIVNNGEACDRALSPQTCNSDCTISVCGDGKVNRSAVPPEQCDDGGQLAGDGCSNTCQLENCGNGFIDPHEECDGTTGPQPCATDCHHEVCGNGILDRDATTGVNEECDDSNTANNDGCSHDCKREFCGDGIVNNHEACDRALTPETCNSDCTISVCGDGKVNRSAVPPEQCDDGGQLAGDGCSNTCQLENCGNGFIDPHEECDGTTGPQPCATDCHHEVCGNGILDRDPANAVAEQCDDGNILDNDGCSHDCKREFCGDGTVNNGEECDRALTPATCNLDCTLSSCGDGKLNTSAIPPEQCDDGNSRSGDGCSSVCRLEHCGNHAVDSGEDCDGLEGLQPCSATCHQEICGNGIVDNDPANAIAEQCDDGNILDNDGCSHDCKREFCGDSIVNNGEECDRALTPATCNRDCTLSRCGDSKLNTSAVPPEQCDDGNGIGGDGCSATCRLEHCGNGVIDPGETCDGAAGPQPCSTSCQAEVCGNGILDRDPDAAISEQCDDGNTLDGDGCSHDCKREFCGDGIVNNGEACDRALTPASCNLDCSLSRCGDGKLNTFAVPPEQCDDGNSLSGDGCSSVCRLEHCGNGVVDSGEDCDGLVGLQPCSATCHTERCGNGILDRDPAHGINEQCDDGNVTSGDGCSSTCVVEFCGDGTLNDHEVCDPVATPATCNLDCTLSTCGDGKVNPFAVPPEQCDDHNSNACGTCSANCQTVTSQRAIGFLVAVSGGQLVDGQTLTIDDGVNPPVVFEFDDEGHVASDHVAVPFADADDATAVQQSLVGAVNGARATQPLLIAAVAEGTVVVSLTHDRPTTLGNRPITETVADPLFLVIGMQGGAGGDCAAGVGCQTNDDCAFHSCSPTTHTCDPDPPAAQVLTSR